ncbi:MAG: YraN family protein [Candidatus Magnetoovum sp. WYHC-5]|nr:YraN family protein [Candidatus Magnetoovum sp. WYHC-5]
MKLANFNLKNLLTGKYGEKLAKKYLIGLGYEIIKENYRAPVGEIDIIARERGQIVFVEVKTRRSNLYGLPFEAVDNRKKQKILKTALYYLKSQKLTQSVRFDIISIYIEGKNKRLEHIKDTIENNNYISNI